MQIIKLADHVAPIGLPELSVSTATRLTDMFSRLLATLFFFTAVAGKVRELVSFINHRTAANDALGQLTFFAAASSRVAVILFLALMGALFLVRAKPIRKARGIRPRFMALAGTFLMSAVTLFPRVEMGLARTLISTLLVMLGMSLSAFVLLHLGRSFSLMAEARHLVTSGPYAVARHPLYLTEEIAALGVLLQFLSPITLAIFFVHVWFQLQRMRNEEVVLARTFPDYADYQVRTARLIPGLY